MNEITNTAVPLVAGLTLGAIFYGGLWWTIRDGLTSDHPAFWFLASHVLRMAVALIGFYFAADGQWQRVLICLAGFLIARVIVTRLTRIAESSRPSLGKESNHASESG